MGDLRDWCISRQLWWGHRIPAYYAEDGTMFVAENLEDAKKESIAKYGKEVPLREETQFGDRVNRTLKDVTFVANLQGAIKFVEISGSVIA